MANVSSEIEHLIAQLAPETRRQRQSALLRPLNMSLIVITLLGLAVNLVSTINPAGVALLGLSLLLNLTIAVLDRRGRTWFAAHLFCAWVNLGILVLVAVNLLQADNLAIGTLFAAQLALSVILAGLLLGVLYAFLFAAVNSAILIVLLSTYTAQNGAEPSVGPAGAVVSMGVPIAAFLFLIAVITWLYQRALARADERLEAARRQIIQDELTRRDLALARELQLRLYPPPPIVNPALQVATRSEPARETSGDFYDFIELDDGLLGIVVADVTGKSVAAALMMALARVAIRSETRRHADPAEVLRAANETISRDHSARQMITAFYGVLDTNSLTLRFANAGHPYPILRRGPRLHEIELGGLPLGGRPDTHYGEQSVQLEPGDQLFLLSDGLIEERNGGREMYGYERLCPAILATDPTDPELALEALWQSVVAFRGTTEQADDITVVVLQALPLAATATGKQPQAPGRDAGRGA